MLHPEVLTSSRRNRIFDSKYKTKEHSRIESIEPSTSYFMQPQGRNPFFQIQSPSPLQKIVLPILWEIKKISLHSIDPLFQSSRTKVSLLDWWRRRIMI